MNGKNLVIDIFSNTVDLSQYTNVYQDIHLLRIKAADSTPNIKHQVNQVDSPDILVVLPLQRMLKEHLVYVVLTNYFGSDRFKTVNNLAFAICVERDGELQDDLLKAYPNTEDWELPKLKKNEQVKHYIQNNGGFFQLIDLLKESSIPYVLNYLF